MTTALFLSDVATAIAGISIANVTVKDVTAIAPEWLPLPNVLYPNPEGWITNFKVSFATFQKGSSAPENITYTLNYRFLGTQIGDIGTFTVAYADVVSKLIAVVNAVIGTHVAGTDGRINLDISDSSISIGVKQDPVGNQYYGFDLAIDVEEIQN